MDMRVFVFVCVCVCVCVFIYIHIYMYVCVCLCSYYIYQYFAMGVLWQTLCCVPQIYFITLCRKWRRYWLKIYGFISLKTFQFCSWLPVGCSWLQTDVVILQESDSGICCINSIKIEVMKWMDGWKKMNPSVIWGTPPENFKGHNAVTQLIPWQRITNQINWLVGKQKKHNRLVSKNMAE